MKIVKMEVISTQRNPIIKDIFSFRYIGFPYTRFVIIRGINILLLLLIFPVIKLTFQFWLQRETSLTSKSKPLSNGGRETSVKERLA